MAKPRFADPLEQLDTGHAQGSLREAGVAPDAQLAPLDHQNMATPFAEAILARRADKPRDIAKIKTALKAEAAAWGDKWIYGWDVKDNRSGRTVRVEGGTIKMANAIGRHFGNCIVETRVFDEGTHWTFYARFVDLETGYTLVRAYRQRKDPNIGMKDAQRALDIVFAIGQSKAIRNVVLNALPDLEAYCREEAKSATIAEIQAKPDGARKWILKRLEEMGVERRRVEAVYGRTAEHWTVPDMAKIVSEVESVEEGMMNATDVWPAAEDVAPNPPSTAEQKRSPAQYVLEDGTALVVESYPPTTPKAGDFIELGGKRYAVLSVGDHPETGRSRVTLKLYKPVEAPQQAAPQPPAPPPAEAGRPQTPPASAAPAASKAPAAPKRQLFGKKGA